MQKKTGKSTGREEVLKANDQVLHDHKCQITALQSCQVSSPQDQLRKSRKANPSDVHQHLCFHVSSVSKGCFMWHLGPGRWTDHASTVRTPESRSEWPAHSGGSLGTGWVKHAWHMWGTLIPHHIPLDKLTAMSWTYQHLHRCLGLWSSQLLQKTE